MNSRLGKRIFYIYFQMYRFIHRAKEFRYRYHVLAGAGFLLILYAVVYSYSGLNKAAVLTNNEFEPISRKSMSNVQRLSDEGEFKQCDIPSLSAFEKSILSYVKTPAPLMCRSLPQLLYRDENAHWRFNYTHIEYLKIDAPNCYYQSVYRSSGDAAVELGPSITFQPPFKIPSEIFTITCRDGELRILLRKSFAQIVPKLGRGRKSSVDSDKYNIIIFGVDNLSRLNAIRRLPKTYSYLTSDMAGYNFKGFTKVGDNTYPNVVAMLSGKDILSPDNSFEKEYQDDIPLIWQDYKKNGYSTLYAEDWSEICAFNNLKKGFLKPPTDHYLRPLYLSKRLVNPVSISRVRLKSADPMSKFDGFYYRNTFNNASVFCHGDTPDHMDVINYHKDFITSYQGHPIFGFSWLTRLAHEDPNQAQIADEDFVNFLSFLKSNDYTKSSFIFFVSDHGPLHGSFTHTYNGYYESRMPIFILIPPDDFSAKFPEASANLRENAEKYRLTSSFDIYQTLYDISQGHFYQSSINYEKRIFRKWSRTGRSLFKQIPVNRKCADAGIREHHCPCYRITPVNKRDAVVKRIAEFIVNEVNKITEILRNKCVFLRHADVIIAYRRETNIRSSDNSLTFMSDDNISHADFVVAIRVTPSNATFEATVSHHNATGALGLMGPISRTNRYGSHSICVDDETLKLFCYCKTKSK